MEANKTKKARPNINISFNIISNNFIADDFESNPKHKKNKKSNDTTRANPQSYKSKQQQMPVVDFSKKKHKKNAYSMDLQSKTFHHNQSVNKNNHTTSVMHKQSILTKNTQKKKISTKNKAINEKKQKSIGQTSNNYLIQNNFLGTLGDFKKGKLSLQELKKKLCSSIFSPQKVKKCQKSKSISLGINSSKKNNKSLTKTIHKQFKGTKSLFESNDQVPVFNIIQTLVNEEGAYPSSRVRQIEYQQSPYCFTQDLLIKPMKVNTSHSVRNFKKTAYKDRTQFQKKKSILTEQDKKAIIIQRAWRNYKTKILIKNMFSYLQVEEQPNYSHSIIENCKVASQQDESLNQIIKMPKQQNKVEDMKQVVDLQTSVKAKDTHNMLIKMIETKMNSTQIQQQECLVNILKIIQSITPNINLSRKDVQKQQLKQSNAVNDNIQKIIFSSQSENEQESNSKLIHQKNNINLLKKEQQQIDLHESQRSSRSSLVSINLSDENEGRQHQYNYSNKANFQIIFDSLKKRKNMIIAEKEQQLHQLQKQLDQEVLQMGQYIKLKKLAEYNYTQKIKQVHKAQKILSDSFKGIKSLLEKESYKYQNNTIRKASSLQYIKRSQCLIENILKSQKKTAYYEQHINQRVKSQQSSSQDQGLQQYVQNHISKKQPTLKQQQQNGQIVEQLVSIYTIDQQYVNNKLQITLQSPISKLHAAQKIDLFQQSLQKQKENKERIEIPQHLQQNLIDFICLELINKEIEQLSKNNRIILKCYKCFKQIKRKATTARGIKTDVQAVVSFLNKVTKLVLNNESNCLEKLNSPMGPSALQILGYMHEFQDQNQQLQDEIVPLILPVSIFQQVQKQVEAEFNPKPLFSEQQKQTSRVNFLKNVIHIHNKALFDGLNEFLDYQRPYGVMGEPFPWKKKGYAHKYNKKQQIIKLQTAVNNVKSSVGYLCGIIPDKQGSIFSNKKFSLQYIQDIRQDRLERYLAQDLINNEYKLLFYDDEETQVLVSIGRSILKRLVTQFIMELYDLEIK